MTLNFLYCLVPVVIVGAAALWLVRRKKRKADDRTLNLMATMAAVAFDVERLPEIAKGFAQFLKESHGVDLGAMSFEKHVQYISDHLGELWNADADRFFPAAAETCGELYIAIAVTADLGELVRTRQKAEWKRSVKEPFLPFLNVEYGDGQTVECDPFDAVFAQMILKDRGAILSALIPFESPEILANVIRNFKEGNVYTSEEMQVYDAYIEKNFGKIKQVLHEKESPDIHVDVYILEQTPGIDATRLVTCGMGARPMPMDDSLREVCPDRLELMIELPPEWPLDMASLEDECNYWPVRVLKILARFPFEQNTWLGFDHSIPWPQPFADNTKLCGVLLSIPGVQKIEQSRIEVSPGKKIQLFQIIPLYQEEMDYKIKYGADKLEELFGDDFSYVVNPTRPNTALNLKE